MKPQNFSASTELVGGISSLNRALMGSREDDHDIVHGIEHFESAMSVLLEVKKDISVIKRALYYADIKEIENRLAEIIRRL